MKNVTTPHLPHSPPSEVEGVKIVVISFGNIAKKKGTVVLKYMGRLLKNKKIKNGKKMKHQFNRTLHIPTPILLGKFSKFTSPPPHYFEARDVSALR